MTEQKEETKGIPILKINSYQRRDCTKRVIVSVKVAVTKYPMPKRIALHVKLKDGSEKVANAHFVSMYKDYAYYLLQAAHARELAPLVSQIQEAKAYEEGWLVKYRRRRHTKRSRNEPC
ncbi:MAG: hypothetical protein ACO2PN_14285 [Pyrobaculum sp.]|jgi:hypothetical protein